MAPNGFLAKIPPKDVPAKFSGRPLLFLSWGESCAELPVRQPERKHPLFFWTNPKLFNGILQWCSVGVKKWHD
jgi:hypothetical protein